MALSPADSVGTWKYLNTYPLTDQTTINLSSVNFDEICVFVRHAPLTAYNQYIIPKGMFSLKHNSYLRSGSDTYNTGFRITSALTLTQFYNTYAGVDRTSESEAIIYYR